MAMSLPEKEAVATAYDYFKNPENYPLIRVANTKEESRVICMAIDNIFSFDQSGGVIGFSQEFIEKFSLVKAARGIE